MTAITKTAKAPNYTPENVAEMTAKYTAAPTRETVDALAESMGKTAKQVIAKLVNLGIYKKATPAKGQTKTGAVVEHKDQTADFIGKVLGLSEGDTDSLTKANKRALQAIAKALATSKPIEGAGESGE